MTKYLAKIENNEITQVIVCESIAWAESRLGGTWVETKIDDPQEHYAGIGMGYDPNAIVKCAPAWRQPANESPYQPGQWVWHGDRLWQCVAANNVWEPGQFGWRDHTEGNIPKWVQPRGAGDQYRLNDKVTHKGRTWLSKNAANVWEPGADGIGSNIWEDITDTSTPKPTIPLWKPWDGRNENLYQVGDEVMYEGVHYRSTTPNNHWNPTVFGWVRV
jgi:hypothetical protein